MGAVPDALLDAVAVAGTADQVTARIARYREAGLTLPIISPRGDGPDALRMVTEAIRAGAP